MKRIGIFGGSFDPVHNAHLAMARAALEGLPLQEILFVPTGTPRYRNPPVASAEHRVAMLKLAIQGEPRYRLDERELAPGASGYTADTLKSLRSDDMIPWSDIVRADRRGVVVKDGAAGRRRS